MRPFDLFHVEADVPDLVADEEVVHLVGEVERRAGEDSDDVERDGVRSQPPDPLHDPAVRPQAFAGLAERVVEEGRPVEADADPHGVRLDEVAPRLRDQRAIGLEGMVNGQAARVVRVDDRQGTLVERDRQDQGFPGMPDNGEAMFHKAAGKDALEDGVQHLGRHPLLRLPGRQVAVEAVDVAERCRLDDQEVERPDPLGPAHADFGHRDTSDRSGSVRTSTSIPDIPGSEPERKTSVVPPVPPVVPVVPAVVPAVAPVVPVGPRGQLEGVGGGVGNGLRRLDLLANLRDPLTDRWPADRRGRTAWRGLGGVDGECRGGDDDAPDTCLHKSVEMAEDLPAIGRRMRVHCVSPGLVGRALIDFD